MNKKISQLIDCDLNLHQREALLEQIGADDVARTSWKCYHLIGNVIRDEVSSTGKDLATLIRNNLEKEPTVLTPLSIQGHASTAKPDMAKTDIWKATGVFAIAASLVLVAVMTLSPLDTLNKENADLGNNWIARVQHTQHEFPESVAHEFDEMLVNHAEFAISPGMSSLIVYARLVSDERLEQ